MKLQRMIRLGFKPTSAKLTVVLLLVIGLTTVLGNGILNPIPLTKASNPNPPEKVQTVAIPSYSYPGPLWTQMEDAYPTVGLAIINPNSGPGAAQNADYADQVASSQAAGLVVLGYVHTSYGNRLIE